MASSGVFLNSVGAGHYKFKVEWSQSKNIEKNTSTITCKLYFINDIDITIKSRKNSCTINDTVDYFISPAISGTGTHLLGTISQNVPHNSDGTKSITMSAVFTIQTTINGTYYEEIKASSTVTLNTILKPSSVSAQSVNFGTESRITITSASQSFTHTLIYSFGSTKGIIAIKTKDTSILWTPPLTLANQIPNSMAGICTITCNTYDGDTSVG